MTTDLYHRFDRVRAASRTLPTPGLAERRKLLSSLRDMVLDNAKPLAAAIAQDFGGRSEAETELVEVVPIMNGIRHAMSSLPRWMRDERRHVSAAFQPAKAWVRYEPLGVIGIIAPWNYPLYLALGPLIDAFAAGNRALIKPSELTPAFSDLLARIVADRFDSDRVSVITGGPDVAQAFSALPFDHLVFTGSTAVGRHVMRAAAENLTPVTLELGGKSPVIVARDYSIEKAARSISFGKFINAGQTCVAPDYVLAPTESAERLAEAVLAAAQQAYPTIQTNDQYSNIITDRHRARLQAGVDEAIAAGARVLTHPDATGPNGKMAPTIVLDPPMDGLLMTEEIFGPVLPVVRYSSLADALAQVNSRERPLALYCYTDDRKTRDTVLDGAISGGATLNGALMHVVQDDLPFGGVGASGSGAYHGRDGFRRFSHARAVHQIGFVNVFEKLGPPWGGLARTTARLLTRR
ncbi:coniferyl-aldehyde dehydrogenase [Sphingomonas sp. PP-F2F-A104-K0414]|uniref:coniferyl aldehyde dehydrogenase n=1 Tax=Sphingomonas sp. PP-F2F-A104-K0414 TaxID=2135661 RepID=UPI00104AC4FA|nr:coniferyl aldehyde dehydrogenase [Sphingomonas sp. PP-F2F-A104-K0414]TCP97417.1 coniferyl-aldehyde dehydrogenase [Sphingomonas sp. PP-F2F-A104-K0414]